jgi:uncharacterized protein
VSSDAARRPFSVALQFHGDLPHFLKRGCESGRVVRTLSEKTSVKDAIEACGVPHPEVDLIVCDGAAVQLAAHLTRDAVVEVYPVPAPRVLHPAFRLQRRHVTQFVADGHLGKLARDLRLLGFDTVYERDAADDRLVRIATEQQRALLTRDRRLLMHAAVADGYCPRSHVADEQLVEVIRRFELLPATQPYSRCLRCNGTLQGVDKESVLEQLEPLTKMYYTDFRRCVECGRIYWSGSHASKLESRIARARRACGREPN